MGTTTQAERSTDGAKPRQRKRSTEGTSQGTAVRRPTLQAFAAGYTPGRPGPKCWCCSLPSDIQKEMERGYRDGLKGVAIMAWLRKCGYASATKNKLDHHFREHVARDAA